MEDLRFYVLFNSSSVISGRCRMVMKAVCNGTSFTVGKVSALRGRGLELRTIRSVCQRLTD